jgi:hypothetical protein
MPPLASPSGIEHRFRVFLPPGYHENTLKRYPVLYMHDGHNLFIKEEAFVGNTWRTDEVINMLDKMNAIEEVIVVGIHPHDRMNEYTIPGYEDYGRFLVENLKPLIDGKYRTLTDPANTAAMGSSLGGVVSFYLGWQGRRCSGRSPASRARSLIVMICLSAFPLNQKEKSGFISTAAGPATITKPLAACGIASSGRDTVLAPSSSTWLFPKLSTTRMHGLRVVRFHSSFFSETCHGSQHRDDPRPGPVKRCAVICRPDSKGAYENTLASFLEARVVR